MEETKTKKTKSKNKGQKVVETKFGIVFQNMNALQKRSLNEFLFAVTDPSPRQYIPKQGGNEFNISRKLPEYDAKSDHLWIREVVIRKNLESGKWEVGEIGTNQGRFGTSTEQTRRIDQQQVLNLIKHLKEDVFEEDLKAFLENEPKENVND